MKRIPVSREVVGLSLACLLFIAIVSGAPAANAGKPINIGYTPPFSGLVTQMALKEAEAIKLAVKEVNDAGGIRGREVKLFTYDCGCDPTKLLGVLKRLKEKDQVVAIIGPMCSHTNLAAKKWAEDNHIPIIGTASMTDKAIHKEGKSWHFRSYAPATEATNSILMRIKKLGYTKVGCEANVLAWGSSMVGSVKALCPAFGLEYVGDVRAEPKTKDLTIQAKKLRGTGAEAVVVTEYPAAQSVWARALMTIGWKPFVISADEVSTFDAIALSSPDLFEGWETKSYIDRTKPYLREVFDKYEAYTGKRHEDENVARAWDAAQLLFEAIRLGGNPDDPAAIRDGFYKIKDFPIVMGRKDSIGSFEIGRNHLLTAKDIVIYRVKAGKLEPVM